MRTVLSLFPRLPFAAQKKFWSMFLTVCLLSLFGFASERLQKLDALAEQWQALHGQIESLRKEHKSLSDKFQEVRKRYEALENQIEKHQREIQQAQKEKQNNNKKKGSNNNDRQLDQKIRDDQNAIDRLKKEQTPLSKSAKELQEQGRDVEKKTSQRMQAMWEWRHEWVDLADLELKLSTGEHNDLLKEIEQRKTSGALGNAWGFLRCIALAGSNQPEAALNALEPFIKDDIWKSKASSLRAYIYWRQGEDSKATGEFGRTVLLDNKDPHYYLLRGIVSVQMGKYADGLRLLESAEKLKVESVRLAYWRALALALEDKPTKNDLESARQYAEEIRKKTPAAWNGYDALAAVCGAEGDFPQAATAQKMAIKVAPAQWKAELEERLKAYQAGQRAKYKWQ
jgi:Flp pilus assembly protein TadD/prefoldin subunit 5